MNKKNVVNRLLLRNLSSFVIVLTLSLMCGQAYSAELALCKIAENAAPSCRRPGAAGFYDKKTNKTFVCWAGSEMNPNIVEYDHAAKQFSDIVEAGGRGNFNDNHDYPQLVKTKGGKLHIFYCTHNKKLWHIQSEHSLSVKGKWSEKEIKNNGKSLPATYPMPIVAENGNLYVFFRVTLKPQDYRPYVYIKSTDNGKSWSSPVRVIDTLNVRKDHLNEIYPCFSHQPASSQTPERILISWTLAGGGPEQHRHDIYHRNMYFAYFNVNDEYLYNAMGKKIGKCINNQQAETLCKVYESGPCGSPIKLPGYQNRPQYIDYRSFPYYNLQSKLPMVTFGDREYGKQRTAQWDGSKWKMKETGYFSGDLRNTGNNVLQMVTSVAGKIVIKTSQDFGKNWKNISSIGTDAKIGQALYINNYHPDLMFICKSRKNIYVGGNTNALKSAKAPEKIIHRNKIKKVIKELEVEKTVINKPMIIKKDDSASGGAYIKVPLGKPSLRGGDKTAGTAQFDFEAEEDGIYVIWLKVYAPGSSHNSLFIKVDDGKWKITDIGVFNKWYWLVARARNQWATLHELKKGNHKIIIQSRETGCRIDKLIITNDLKYKPE